MKPIKNIMREVMEFFLIPILIGLYIFIRWLVICWENLCGESRIDLDRLYFLCLHCGYVGKPEKFTKGNIWIVIIPSVCLLIPELIYALWKQFFVCWEELKSRIKAKGCPMCQSSMIPAGVLNCNGYKRLYKCVKDSTK